MPSHFRIDDLRPHPRLVDHAGHRRDDMVQRRSAVCLCALVSYHGVHLFIVDRDGALLSRESDGPGSRGTAVGVRLKKSYLA